MSEKPARRQRLSSAPWRKITGRIGQDAIIDVTMLGSIGVGKTTLLASMYERFGQVIGTTDLQVTPTDRKTSVSLQGYIEDLRRIADGLRVQGGIQGTGELRDYAFDVGRKGRAPLFKLRFTDYPGKYLLNPDNSDDEKLQRALERAHVILVAIDAAALLERNGRYHNLINIPQIVTDEIKRMLQVRMDRLIILAPLKCETYVEKPPGAQELKAKIIDEYRTLLNYIGSGELRERVGCVITPVQTVGSVVFHRLEEDPQHLNPVFEFRVKAVGARYAPLHTDQLLRYALRFVVNKYRDSDHRGVMRAWWERAMGTDAAMVEAAREFAAGCKSDDGFGVLQSHPYLDGQ
ncbi:hypothetical protein FXF51_20905 [Nonomuraea sp. PA05]|uniref:TRAFAC clade GTPase domain-containing protein n=1 Tax=Nonomuraea sp. PA05 TaxID=2604466 RepID=UPI0011D6BFF0|nr:GTPase [Nonomuraea sp. PA05]TYB64902.1 hypothetical protein FXF51_20905 [Nonomuraea sp. PA05]